MSLQSRFGVKDAEVKERGPQEGSLPAPAIGRTTHRASQMKQKLKSVSQRESGLVKYLGNKLSL